MSKDDRLLLAEAGLICLEEIISMTDVEIEQIKAVVTLPQVVERAAYARNKEVRPHIASFCGTGNQINFLTDDDNRRWLPFEVADILSPYDHPINYPGLYGQVKYLLESGFMYWFDRSEIDLLKKPSPPFRGTLSGRGTDTDLLPQTEAGRARYIGDNSGNPRENQQSAEASVESHQSRTDNAKDGV